MARIKIAVTGTKLFSFQTRIRITDINYGNHLGNDALVSILHDARCAWLSSIGASELSIGGVSLIMGDLAVEFKAEGFFNDELLIEIFADDLQASSFDLLYRVNVVRDNKEALLVLAKTGMVCFDYNLRKVTRLTEELKEILSRRFGSRRFSAD